jgi:hypothetical protein
MKRIFVLVVRKGGSAVKNELRELSRTRFGAGP